MEFQDVVPFLEQNHRGVISTKRPCGSVHSSIVVCGAYREHAVFVSVYPKSQKIRNLRRNSDCTVLAVTKDWHSYAVIEGTALLMDYGNTDQDDMRIILREAYMACSKSAHSDWAEYDQAMVKQEAVVVLVRPTRVYA